jgi:hypothetical protein
LFRPVKLLPTLQDNGQFRCSDLLEGAISVRYPLPPAHTWGLKIFSVRIMKQWYLIMHQPGHIGAFKATLLQDAHKTVRGKLGLQDNSRGTGSSSVPLSWLRSDQGSQLVVNVSGFGPHVLDLLRTAVHPIATLQLHVSLQSGNIC